MNNKVIFFGALGDKVGGGESGNKRTLFFLNKLGYEVLVIPKPYPIKSKLKYVFYPLSLFWSIIHFTFKSRRVKYSHISAFYGNLIYIEIILVLISKLLRKKVVYEIRGGGMDYFLDQKGFLYEFCFRVVIRLSDVILSQGKENFKTLNEILSNENKIYYYPNVLSEDKMPDHLITRNYTGNLNLIFFGRLARDKNIKTIILSIKELINNSSINYKLKLIGEFDDLNYEKEVSKEVLGFEKYISILPPCSFNELRLHLIDSHFFIFPSSNLREGQSNSLTESILYGVIPIASYQGFNKSTIDKELFMFKEINHQVISRKIIKISSLGQNELSSLSHNLQEKSRVKFSEKNAINVLSEIYGQ
jgi:glycosyltransferase involved in cell wall biosynthesis